MAVQFSANEKLEWYSFRRGRNERVLAVWIPGRANDDASKEVLTDMVLAGLKVRKAWAIDVLNGDTHQLAVKHESGNALLKGMRIHDWPLIVRLEI
jgi:hypothetical protein